MSPHQRLEWADAAKGICILLVVLHHVTGKHFASALPEDLLWVEGPWLWATAALKPLRMPLFFVLSGYFASSALRRPWRAVAGPRLASPYYLYVLWLGIHAVVFSVERTLPMNRTRDAGEMLLDLVWASTGLWYLYALTVYFLVLRLLRPLPRKLVLALALLVAVAGWALPIDEVNRAAVLQSFVYFAGGALFPGSLGRIANLPGRHTTVTLTVAYAALVALLLSLGAGRGWTAALLSLVAVPMAIRLSRAVTAWPRAALLGRVGRSTLPVYVMHVPLLALVHHLPSPVPAAERGTLALALAVAYPLLLTATLVAVSLVIGRVLESARLGWLLQRPTSAVGMRQHRDHVVLTRRPQVIAAEHVFHAQARGGGVPPELFDRVVAAVRGPLPRVEPDQQPSPRRQEVGQRA